MQLFLLGLVLLVVGYFFYGKLVEKVLGPDDRGTPARTMHDGVDFLVLPHWKNMLIQLLNIAGIGPVIGVILGIKFGVIAFLIIPIGNIIGGSVHDFVSGMMSLRHRGANLPALIRMTTGNVFYTVFSVFMAFLLLLVVAVFINVPANLIADMASANIFWYAVAVIFIYYIVATVFPVDKIIGALYPYFGGLLLIGTALVFVFMMIECCNRPELLTETAGFKANMFTAQKNMPIIPMLFVTIACGILSGFHATQSPIIARTMASERQARSSFYGMMVVEGVIAMIWAAAALVVYNLRPELMLQNPTSTLVEITTHFLNSKVGAVTVASVVILAITSGDTAMRSLRLSSAEIFHIDQKPLRNRILLALPLIVLVAALLWWSNQNEKTFQNLWNYFAWGNQVLAAATLTAATVWLTACRKTPLLTLIPGIFMTYIVTTYILWISPAHGGPVGFGMELEHASLVAGFFAVILAIWAWNRGTELRGRFDR